MKHKLATLLFAIAERLDREQILIQMAAEIQGSDFPLTDAQREQIRAKFERLNRFRLIRTISAGQVRP